MQDAPTKDDDIGIIGMDQTHYARSEMPGKTLNQDACQGVTSRCCSEKLLGISRTIAEQRRWFAAQRFLDGLGQSCCADQCFQAAPISTGARGAIDLHGDMACQDAAYPPRPAQDTPLQRHTTTNAGSQSEADNILIRSARTTDQLAQRIHP